MLRSRQSNAIRRLQSLVGSAIMQTGEGASPAFREYLASVRKIADEAGRILEGEIKTIAKSDYDRFEAAHQKLEGDAIMVSHVISPKVIALAENGLVEGVQVPSVSPDLR